jgi:hypothetical protein
VHKYEEALKKWLIDHASRFEKDFQFAMQMSEREIMQSFAFKNDLRHGGSLHSTMGETISLQGDHIIV